MSNIAVCPTFHFRFASAACRVAGARNKALLGPEVFARLPAGRDSDGAQVTYLSSVKPCTT
eukprot:3945166-Amphidinium_carterae.1